MVRDLISDDGWGNGISVFQSAKKLYYRTKLALHLERVITPIGEAAGAVKIHGNSQFLASRNKRTDGLNPDYSWKLAEAVDDWWITKVNNIHIDFSIFESSDMPISSGVFHAAVLIHESTHRFALTADFAYTERPEYANLTVAQSVNNADSLAFLCVSWHKQLLITKAMDIDFDI